MKKTLLILFLLAACGRDDPAADNRAAPAGPAGPAATGESRPASPKGAATGLTGLYEGGSGAQKNQMCVVEKGREAQFGLLVWGGNLHSCSGAGRAVRNGDRLTLTMTGDETCTINATLRDGAVTLPASLPLGCAYYCGARASMAGASFTKRGSGEADVKKARDIAGDPLCE
ncbi:MAG TPA: hypothetical protein VE891_15850 [Allosphingosinicella sp.]|nr:hypothetical protein [Allosphingosinicella sp.]